MITATPALGLHAGETVTAFSEGRLTTAYVRAIAIEPGSVSLWLEIGARCREVHCTTTEVLERVTEAGWAA